MSTCSSTGAGLLPDDVSRPVGLQQLARLWRGLVELSVLDASAEALLQRLKLPAAPGAELSESVELHALASAGALLGGAGSSTLVTQVVWTEDGRRDPYALDGEPDPDGFRDYMLYGVESADHLFLPLVPAALFCAGCGKKSPLEAREFGEGALLVLGRPCPHCQATLDLGRDKAELRSGAVFLLEEIACRAALSIELPAAPQSEELPDAAVAELLRGAFGSYDELADDAVPPAE